MKLLRSEWQLNVVINIVTLYEPLAQLFSDVGGTRKHMRLEDIIGSTDPDSARWWIFTWRFWHSFNTELQNFGDYWWDLHFKCSNAQRMGYQRITQQQQFYTKALVLNIWQIFFHPTLHTWVTPHPKLHRFILVLSNHSIFSTVPFHQPSGYATARPADWIYHPSSFWDWSVLVKGNKIE